jgi:type II secretory pathway predicted ATPase ExeA
MSWLNDFQLKSSPFTKEIEDKDLFLPASKVKIVDDIIEGIEEHATGILLVGDAGLGKNCVLRAVRHRLQNAPVRLTYCHNATLGRRDFYRLLCQTLGLAPKATAAAIFYALSTHVKELSREQIHPVFILDEAHLLNQDVCYQARPLRALQTV